MSDISSIRLPDNSIHNIKSKKIFYAECATARNVIAKVIDCEGFVLETGAIIAVRFTDTSTASPTSGNITLNINNTGAKNIILKSNNAVYTYGWAWAFCNNQTWLFVYNGTYFVCINQDNNTTYTPMSLGFGYGTCSTAEATAAKVAALASYVLVKNGMVSVKFSHAVPANSTLNINSKGAKNIFYRGAKIAAGVINAGDIATFVYDGTQYQLISVDANYARKTDLPAIDTALSATSINPVQNKIINTALTGKANSSHTHSKSDITDFPSALPANGGNADTVDGLHAGNFLLKGSLVQFVPYNMLYYALNDKICLFSNNDDATRGIYFINNSSSSVTVCVLVSATAEGPVCQYGYGANTYPEIQNTGENREWFTVESIPTSPVIYAMEVPPGKLGYFGFYFNSASAYTTIHDIRCPYFNFF